ncbi:hypothetical protein [Marinobacterium rhizophilum]|uniref:hypothetical protein n=1 Tax=Marinobacterium rhizophilum TaxID=420402 RepID=UPI0003772EA3|nr:hypothetical protein [Marinobacterium rhizophilum]
MNRFGIEAWYKPEGADKSAPLGLIRFRVTPDMHLKLSDAEDQLNDSDKLELDIDIEQAGLELETPPECGALKDCKFHVYHHKNDPRAHFFLVGHRVSDNALVYSNAIVIDQLG